MLCGLLELGGSDVVQRVLCKMLHDVRHLVLKAGGRIFADEAASLKTPVLKVMWDTARYHGIAAARRVGPFAVDKQTYCAR
jgi:hypothetical protein